MGGRNSQDCHRQVAAPPFPGGAITFVLYYGHVRGIFLVSFHMRRGLETPKSLFPAVDLRRQHTTQEVASGIYLWPRHWFYSHWGVLTECRGEGSHSDAVAILENPGIGLVRFRFPDILKKQFPKALMVFPSQPVYEFQEDQPIESRWSPRRRCTERTWPSLGVTDSNVPPYRGSSGECYPFD